MDMRNFKVNQKGSDTHQVPQSHPYSCHPRESTEDGTEIQSRIPTRNWQNMSSYYGQRIRVSLELVKKK